MEEDGKDGMRQEKEERKGGSGCENRGQEKMGKKADGIE